MQGRLEAIQDGVMPLEMGETDRLHNQAGLLSRLVEDLRTLSLAGAERLTLELHLPPQPIYIRADADRMAQIVSNLFGKCPGPHACGWGHRARGACC